MSSLNKQKNNSIETGIIGKYYEDNLPVIVSFENSLPDKDIRVKCPYLTVISWHYDGSKNNGMPSEIENNKMLTLEGSIDKILESSKEFQRAYNRTGNNLKEFILYISNQSQFMDILNTTLASHEKYPIGIKFYEDPNWSELSKLIDDFKL
ncbi:DUF695 domain-containing protein [Flammeovirga sp. EKP202]|uniref:DUF695 domain-containing protein n=1 Tax=Flammeovirga sp. EKP202 TaxID=2770592 RepID=UPI00165FF7E4|nr:DUF695 domain-containing protein [Flammeovirga sp. EKP202]MBD0403902.1 DUF695 domain-containing protein [Flammeovirga sp. EKP202]